MIRATLAGLEADVDRDDYGTPECIFRFSNHMHALTKAEIRTLIDLLNDKIDFISPCDCYFDDDADCTCGYEAMLITIRDKLEELLTKEG